MASGNRTGYGNWELDKGEINLDYCDVGLGLKLPWQQQQQQQQQQQHQQQQQQQQQQSSFSSGRDSITAVPWLQTRQNRQENRSSSPTISGFHQISRFGDGGRLTFTAGQRQELERQTIIYKYMMASMPVPPELLIPLSKYPSSTITTSSSTSSVVRKTGVEMRYVTGRGGDPEPWRCRRTDGKKWRCSRDVAPDQKYCERHSHKGRPSRSRKPVESSSSPSPSILSPPLPLTTTTTNTTTPSVTTSNPIVFTPFAIPKPSSSSFDLPSPSQFNSLPRYPDWFMKKDVAPPNATTAPACLYTQQIGETRASAVDDHQSCLLSRPFIDAWSLGDHVDPKDATNTIDNDNNSITTNKCPTPSSPLNSILPLTLSMSAGFDHDHDHHTSDDNTKDHLERSSLSSASHHHHHQPFNWMNSWISSPPGGPLAEALCLGISGAGNGRMGSHSDDQLVSPHGHSTSSSTTTLG
ncbi:hypothetical protein BVRB_5g104140 isoform A [Beta vulgaris subsp. vulgaris]|uniref:growth-regulating factor 3 isoform X2 n=1 Tax=Beta vulgaris subsp. vulgaris TaxID=3555 RepID=UPI00065C4353|nr:growth-regulating factor 3 isoform X2 [Beta vulgaris subsp. vulgaris]KMT12486.1 hypothetical protein BVRB_5g104140 isoform A [Beta vulgaris subsp. vulgaris]